MDGHVTQWSFENCHDHNNRSTNILYKSAQLLSGVPGLCSRQIGTQSHTLICNALFHESVLLQTYRVVLTKPNGIQQQRQMAKLHVLSPDFHWNLAQHSLLTQTKLAAEEKENFGPWGAVLHCRSLWVCWFCINHLLWYFIFIIIALDFIRNNKFTGKN